MNTPIKFKLKTYIRYLFLEPWTSNFSMPNFRTMTWILIIIALIFRISPLLIISIIVGAIFYLMYEFKSGKYIYWYRQRKFKEQREALKKVRGERRKMKK